MQQQGVKVVDFKCPYGICGRTFKLAIEENELMPILHREECKNCYRLIWVYLSRITPVAHTEAEFKKFYKFDRGTKRIQPISND